MSIERIPLTLDGWLDRYDDDFGFVPSRPDSVCDAEPGSAQRKLTLARRYAEGSPLFVDGDSYQKNGIVTNLHDKPLECIWRGNQIWGAEYSQCEQYRYRLWQRWDESKPIVAFIGLNPSTGTEVKLDKTLRRIKGFCLRFGWGGFEMLNLFAYRSTDPSNLEKSEVEPIGDGNDRAIRQTVEKCSFVVCCWGVGGALSNRGARVLWGVAKTIPKKNVHCFGLTKPQLSAISGRMVGYPKPPLYLPEDNPVIELPWSEVDCNDDFEE